MPFNVQAALGLAQFERLDELIKIKRHHYEFYKKELSHLDVQFNSEPDNVFNGVWITGMVLGENYGMDKHEFINKLDSLGIPVRPFFYPLSSIPAYNLEKEYIKKNSNSYKISNRGVNLPGAANLTDDQLKEICDNIKKVLER